MWLLHYLRYVEPQIAEQAAGTTFAAITTPVLGMQLVPFAPLPEQGRIVAKLGQLLARTARARVDFDRIPILIAKYKEALLVAAFSGELTRDWRNEQSSVDWEFVRAGDLFKWASGKFLPRKDQRDGPVPVFGGNGVNGHHDEALYSQPTIVIGRVGAHCGNVHLTLGPAWITDK
jgi:type I restriction enzyme S subunit